jgi:hypothetical protein
MPAFRDRRRRTIPKCGPVKRRDTEPPACASDYCLLELCRSGALRGKTQTSSETAPVHSDRGPLVPSACVHRRIVDSVGTPTARIRGAARPQCRALRGKCAGRNGKCRTIRRLAMDLLAGIVAVCAIGAHEGCGDSADEVIRTLHVANRYTTKWKIRFGERSVRLCISAWLAKQHHVK